MPTLYEVTYIILREFQLFNLGESLSICVKASSGDTLDKIIDKAYCKICHKLNRTDLLLRFSSMKVI